MSKSYTLALKRVFEYMLRDEIKNGTVRIIHYPFGMYVAPDPDLGEHLVCNGGKEDIPIPFIHQLKGRKYNLVVDKIPDGIGLSDDEMEFCVARTGCWMNGYVRCDGDISDMKEENTTLTVLCDKADDLMQKKVEETQISEIEPGVHILPEYEGFPVYLIEVTKMQGASSILYKLFQMGF